jgi:hypothetical protein
MKHFLALSILSISAFGSAYTVTIEDNGATGSKYGSLASFVTTTFQSYASNEVGNNLTGLIFVKDESGSVGGTASMDTHWWFNLRYNPANAGEDSGTEKTINVTVRHRYRACTYTNGIVYNGQTSNHAEASSIVNFSPYSPGAFSSSSYVDSAGSEDPLYLGQYDQDGDWDGSNESTEWHEQDVSLPVTFTKQNGVWRATAEGYALNQSWTALALLSVVWSDTHMSESYGLIRSRWKLVSAGTTNF